MQKTIVLEVTHPEKPSGPIEGFRYMWAYYVNGYDHTKHCQPCFKGRPVAAFVTNTARSGTRVEIDRMDAYPFVYICGVGTGSRSELGAKNFHLPLKYCEGQTVEATTYNGYLVKAENACNVQIEALPPGWNGLPLEHTRCKNFQFAVGAFGYPEGGFGT